MVGTGLVVMFPVAGHSVRPQIALHAENAAPEQNLVSRHSWHSDIDGDHLQVLRTMILKRVIPSELAQLTSTKS